LTIPKINRHDRVAYFILSYFCGPIDVFRLNSPNGEQALPTVNANGITLTYDTSGDPNGVPVLLIMGLGMQLIAWPEDFVQGLVERGFYVIRFDNRDCGLSTKFDRYGTPNLALAFVKLWLRLPLSSAYTLTDMAQDAIELLDALGVAKAHIVGVSMGGMIAQIVAANYPERVMTLTSIMSSSGRRGLPGPSTKARRALFSRPKDPRDPQAIVDHLVRVLRIIGSPAYPTPEPVLRDRIGAMVRRNVCMAGTARQIVAIAASGDRVKLLKGIRAPALVIHGADDPLVPVACGRDTARWIPGAALRIVDGMGHDLAPGLNATLLSLINAHCRRETVPEISRSC
jgi:pimeloyl-ACP methyl ester carboxylesterase